MPGLPLSDSKLSKPAPALSPSPAQLGLRADGLIAYASPAAQELTGRPRLSLPGRSIESLFHEEGSDPETGWWERAKRQGFLAPLVGRHAGKSPLRVQLHLQPLQAAADEAPLFLGTLSAIDFPTVSDPLPSLAQLSGELAYQRELDGRLVAVNPPFARKFGKTPAGWIGESVETLLHPEDVREWRSVNRQISRLPYRGLHEHRYRTVQGWRWIAWEEGPVLSEGGEVLCLQGIGRDVTKRRLAEEQYYKLARAVEQCPVSIVITDAQGAVQYVNPKFTETSGYTLEELLERRTPVLREGHPSEESYQRFWENLMASGEWRGELCSHRKTGERVWEAVKVSLLRGPSGEITHILSLREDVSSRKKLEEQLRQAQKMDSIGTLAGGIAHDFNNLLAIINGYTEITLTRIKPTEKIAGYLREVQQAAQRATGLVRQILTFSRKTEVQAGAVNLNNLVRELARMLSETFPRTISLVCDLDEALPTFKADQNQLQQVLMNLCVNARDALPRGGRLTVSTLRVPGRELIHLGADGVMDYVCIRVVDTGVGMSPQVRQRIFEPFFTTKPMEHGTGLGLAVVYGIVVNHRGHIDVESAEGVGSTFSVYLPLAPASDAQPIVRPAIDDLPGGSERLLVVEDESSLRALMRVVLEKKGYRVATAADGREALEYLANKSHPLDLVLLDLNMPSVHGLDVFRKLRSLRPELRALVVSGNISVEIRAQFEQLGLHEFLQKPFRLEEAVAQVRLVLDKPKG